MYVELAERAFGVKGRDFASPKLATGRAREGARSYEDDIGRNVTGSARYFLADPTAKVVN